MLAAHDYHLLNDTLTVAALLFATGVIGFVARRNLVVVILSAGLMLQAGMLMLVSFGAFHGNAAGQVFSLFALAVMVLEGTLALVVCVVFVRRENSLDVSRLRYSRTEHEELPEETHE